MSKEFGLARRNFSCGPAKDSYNLAPGFNVDNISEKAFVG
jgi:hypothetical protein